MIRIFNFGRNFRFNTFFGHLCHPHIFNPAETQFFNIFTGGEKGKAENEEEEVFHN